MDNTTNTAEEALDLNKTRAEFEAWARSKGSANFMRMAGDPEAYDDLILRAQFKAWCAALARRSLPVDGDWLTIARKHGYAFPDKRMEAFVTELLSARAGSAAPAGQQAAPSEQVQKMVQKVFDWAELRESEAARFFHNSRICDIQQLVEFIMKNHIPFVPDHSFDHLEGRGLHELRTDELPAYLSAVAHNHGARSEEFITAAQWVASEIDRKTTEELVAAKRAHELADSLKEAKAATNLAWNEALELAATTCDYAKKSTPPRQLAEQIRSLKDKALAKRADSLPYESLLNGFISIMGVEDSGDLLNDARKAIDKVNALIASEFAASLEAGLAKNDAARYRWLCSNNYDRQSVQIHTWHHWYEPHSVTGEPTEWKARVRGCALDQIIDAAIAAQPKDTTDSRRDA